MMDHKIAITYDEMILIPQYSEVSRTEVDLSTTLCSDKNPSNALDLYLPFIVSPMDTVTSPELASRVAWFGGAAILHRYQSPLEQKDSWIEATKDLPLPVKRRVGVAVGVDGDFLIRSKELYEAGCRLFCIDVAHGYHKKVEFALSALRNEFSEPTHIMAGNVVSNDAVEWLYNNGADSVRVNIGTGSICSTQIQTGHGYPAAQTLIDIDNDLKKKIAVVSDGGIRQDGDIVKALALGAAAVMMGSAFAGTDEAPGEKITINGEVRKVYRGLASKEAQMAWRGKVKSFEGVSHHVALKGPVQNILEDMVNHVCTGLSYSGADSLSSFRDKCKWSYRSLAGAQEGAPHILRS